MSRPSGSKGHKNTHASHHERWLLSYADFVTLLFALFVVLFASARHDNENLAKLSKSIHSGFDSLGANSASDATPAKDGKLVEHLDAIAMTPGTAESQVLATEMASVLKSPIAKHQIIMQTTQEGLVISLRELGFFQSGDARLLPEASEPLRQIAGVLAQHRYAVRVEGHSDDQPIHNAAFQSNWELSTARGMTVLLLLLNNSSLDPARISLAGYGQYRPVADNSTAEGRRTNRRVDLVILSGNADRAPSYPHE